MDTAGGIEMNHQQSCSENGGLMMDESDGKHKHMCRGRVVADCPPADACDEIDTPSID